MKKLLKTVRKMYRKGVSEKGFTLIELLVVVGILGILAGVVTLNIGGFIGKGQAEAMATELHNVQTAVTAYQAENGGAIPASIEALGQYFLGPVKYGPYSIDQTTGLVTRGGG